MSPIAEKVTAPPKPAQTASKAKKLEDEFWKSGEEMEYGWFRQAKAPNPHPEHLVVFVHGVLSDYRKAWKCTPHYILEYLDTDIDLFSFWYASGLFQAGSYETAAVELATRLKTQDWRHYRHIIFVVHSTGGLVVNAMLAAEHDAMEADYRQGKLDWMNRSYITPRVRKIVHIGVPHEGGSSVGKIAFSLLSPIYFPIAFALGLLNRVLSLPGVAPRFPLGVNRIFPQLVWQSSKLARLSRKLDAFFKFLNDSGLPSWTELHVLGSGDGAIRPIRDSISTAMVRSNPKKRITLRGSHPGVKYARSASSTNVDTICDEWSFHLKADGCCPSVLAQTLTLLDRAIAAGTRLENHIQIRDLVATKGEIPAAMGDDERRSDDNYWLGSQGQVFDELLRRCQLGGDRAERLLVTGAPGVGKSAVLRRLGMTLAASALRGEVVREENGKSPTRCLPIYIPLFRYGVGMAPGQAPLEWLKLAQWWTEERQERNVQQMKDAAWTVKQVERSPQVDANWLLNMVKQERCVIIIDGVDDYLARHPRADVGDLNRLLVEIDGFVAQRVSTKIVLGVRSSNPIGGIIGGNAFEVARLTVVQAKNMRTMLVEIKVGWEKSLASISARLKRIYRRLRKDERLALLERLMELIRKAVREPDLGVERVRQALERDQMPEELDLVDLSRCQLIPGNTAWFDEAEGLANDISSAVVSVLLKRVRDSNAKKMLLTPLILSKIVKGERFEHLETSADIFEEALRVVIEQSEALSAVAPNVTVDEWLDALTLIGHLFFVHYWSTAEIPKIRAAAEERVSRWKALCSSANVPAEARSVCRGFELAGNPITLEALLKQSLFVIVGTCRFEHREWEEFLAARYIAYALRFQAVEELSGRGTFTRMHMWIEGILQRHLNFQFSSELLYKVHTYAVGCGLGRLGPPTAQIPIGNLLGALGHSTAKLEPEVARELIDRYLGRSEDDIPPLVELVALQTLGYRALRRHKDDLRHRELGKILLSKVTITYFTKGARASNAFVEMVAWCIGKALAPRLGEQWNVRKGDWKISTEDTRLMRDALRFVATKEGNTWKRDGIDETMQRVFVELIPEMLDPTHRAKTLAGCTYLVCLVAAQLNSCAADGVTIGLKRLMDNSKFGVQLQSEVHSFVEVPELATIWDLCKRSLTNRV
ncbi:MAG: hypothetical protein JNJ82_04645 [Opitutaceae bacterium]|nr:hypothetical protein [Opitutaceae bacterium]